MTLKLLALSIALLLSSAAAAVPERVVKPGMPIRWGVEHYPRAVRFRVGRLELLVRPLWEEKDQVGPRLTIYSPGKHPLTIDGETSFPTSTSTIWVGRWNRAGEPFVLLDSYSGGAHCCDNLQLAVPEHDHFRVVSLGDYDGVAIPGQPRDLDHDGRIDFIVDDENFIYAFAGHAESLAPPVILNVVDGHVIDVSARRSFAPIFRRDMAMTRKRCLAPKREPQRNGPCAAFVADAARLGRFKQAWREMLRVYDRKDDWQRFYPAGCRKWNADGSCPQAQTVHYANYPDALRAFLKEGGYIR